MLEEASRVPLIMSFPGQMPAGKIVNEVVGHMDIYATIMDYLGVSNLDESDGSSLRRYIDDESWNENFQEDIVVVELEKRIPLAANRLTGSLGNIPNFMIRKGDIKLILPKNSESLVTDMMYDLSKDPYETNNLLGRRIDQVDDSIIGQAEYLKILLQEWMVRMDGPKKYYSDNKYNLFEGSGDIAEIRQRRTWKRLDLWQSHQSLDFGKPVLVDAKWRRNEYLYFGRTTEGTTVIQSIVVKGNDAEYFTVSPTQASLSQNEHVRVKVAFESDTEFDISSVKAWVEVQTNLGNNLVIRINGVE